MVSKERAWLLISRAVSREISVAEQEELDLIFAAFPEIRSDFERVINLRIIPTSLPFDEHHALIRGLNKFDDELYKEREFAVKALLHENRQSLLPRGLNTGWIIAATVVIMLMAGFWASYTKKDLSTAPKFAFVTPNGKKIHTILPDGSVVWLNSASTISYTNNVNKSSKREVYLNGEAYFDIKHDAQHPFIVHAGMVNIVVLGTAFNVKAYSNDSFIETTLIRGKVALVNNNDHGSVITMFPNEKISISTIKNLVKKVVLANKAVNRDSIGTSAGTVVTAPVLPDAAIDETAWLNNRLSFKQESFTKLALRLERWYNVKFFFDDDNLSDKLFTGTFTNQGINEVMRALQIARPFHYSITNNQIHIW